MNKPLFVAALCAALVLAACDRSEQATDKTVADEAVTEQATTEVDLLDMPCGSANEEGVINIGPGLSARILKNGYGRMAERDDYVGVHADLWLFDGTQPGNKGLEVWSSGGEAPFEFQIGHGSFIKGWSPGIRCMLLGEKRELKIAPELAYGARGRPPVPGNATLLYELELVNLVSPDEAAAEVVE